MAGTTTPAGSSTYSSDTMYVGDGTWVSSENTFLLPNLQGLNFATMQYNSMSHRFASISEYHRLIIGHGVLAAIVFLLIVPSAIFIAKFYYRNPRLALRLHIWLQILTVGLLTVVFILGWVAVGPERSLTNPHHGIGVAIYVLILVQAIGGGLIHHIEKGKARWRLPLKLMLHQWLGRAIALLGIVQIPLGMTLYGSPKYLFVLFALAAFAWLLLYLVLTYINRPVLGDDGYGTESYVSGPSGTEITEDRRTGHDSNHRFRNAALLGGAGLASLSMFRRRSRSRSRSRSRNRQQDDQTSRTRRRDDQTSRTSRTDASLSRLESRHSNAYTVEDEKYSSRNQSKGNNTWRDRLLKAGAGVGAYAGFKRLFSRSKARDEESDVTSYRAASGTQNPDRADVERVQHGEAPMSPGDSRVSRSNRPIVTGTGSPTRQNLRSRGSRDSFSSNDSRNSYDSGDEPRQTTGKGHGMRDGIATLGVVGYFKEKQRQRREKKEQRRSDDMRRQDDDDMNNINRNNGNNNNRNNNNSNDQQYNGRPQDSNRRRRSRADTVASDDWAVTGSNPELTRNNRPMGNRRSQTDDIGPLNGPARPPSIAATPTRVPNYNDPNTVNLGYDPNSGVGPIPGTSQYPPTSMPAYPVATDALQMPSGAIEPDSSRLVQPQQGSRTYLPQNPSASFSPTRSDSRDRPYNPQNRRNSVSRVGTDNSPASVASPPVSVKVQMHKDGRHVTLRRLNEEEAAAERDARKQERRQRRRRAESLSSGIEDEGTRFRRNEATRPGASMPISNAPRPPSSSQANELNLPTPPSGPPPVPQHSLSPQAPGRYPPQAASGITSGVGSPGTYETGTDLSNFDNNRRRRRAERAAAKQQRAAQQGSRVEFS